MKVSFDFLCLDERDSPNLTELSGKSRKEIKNIKNRRYFGICGVIIPGAEYPEININGRKIQEKCFGVNQFHPFHYVDILNTRDCYSFLRLNHGKQTSLHSLLNNFIAQTKFKIISSFIDKQKLALDYGIYPNGVLTKVRKIKPNMQQTTSPRGINLYEISLKYLMGDYYKYLSTRNRRGIIIAEARGEKEDNNLLDAFYHYQRSGAGSLSGIELRTHIVDLLIIRKSQNHIGTQIADLITYPLYDYFIPNHNTRKDHFLRQETFGDKIISNNIFPK